MYVLQNTYLNKDAKKFPPRVLRNAYIFVSKYFLYFQDFPVGSVGGSCKVKLVAKARTHVVMLILGVTST